ncbi:hypothetical protein EYF80_016548 [Liparis tanakae]|uniref:Uncharacterized protein n=1 Tax=Liparis tanakae TaxID=230148 RepID=A0A4Z2I5C4_9TELE|nr:hypothetical protein EYF80_016548 [Liparis tanakae]
MIWLMVFRDKARFVFPYFIEPLGTVGAELQPFTFNMQWLGKHDKLTRYQAPVSIAGFTSASRFVISLTVAGKKLLRKRVLWVKQRRCSEAWRSRIADILISSKKLNTILESKPHISMNEGTATLKYDVGTLTNPSTFRAASETSRDERAPDKGNNPRQSGGLHCGLHAQRAGAHENTEIMAMARRALVRKQEKKMKALIAVKRWYSDT